MKVSNKINVFGDVSFRDKKCPSEDAEQITIMNWLRINYNKYFELAVHVKQEGLKTKGEASKDSIMGLRKGWSDITIVGNPMMLCELKRADHTKSRLSVDQSDFLIKAENAGAFSCVALGHEGFILAFKEWIKLQEDQI